jgi:hypothetical protein
MGRRGIGFGDEHQDVGVISGAAFKTAAGPAQLGQTGGAKEVALVVAHPLIAVITGIHRVGDVELMMVVRADSSEAGRFGFGEGRQQHTGEDGNDGDDDEEFYQREGGTRRTGVRKSVAASCRQFSRNPKFHAMVIWVAQTSFEPEPPEFSKRLSFQGVPI